MKKRRILAWFMAVIMAVGLMPATALAADTGDSEAELTTLTPADETVNGVAKLHKQATWNNEDNAFDVTLQVTADMPIKSQPVDVVLLLDGSGSMNYKLDQNVNAGENETSRNAAVKAKANELVDNLASKGDQVNVGVVEFGGAAKTGDPDTIDLIGLTPLSKNTNGNAELKTKINELGTSFHTHTDQGLEAAGKMLTNGTAANNGHKKVIILLSDGVPGDSGNYSESIDQGGTYKENPIIGARKTAENLKIAGVEIFTVGFALNATDRNGKYPTVTIGQRPNQQTRFVRDLATESLKAIATDVSHFSNANTTTDLGNIFTTIADRLKSLVSDPIGDGVTLVGNVEAEVKNVQGGSVPNAPAATTSKDQNNRVTKIEWDNLTNGLENGQTLTLKYSVKLNDASTFTPGTHTVRLNGDGATLNYISGNTTVSKGFPQPCTTVKVGKLVEEYYLNGEKVDNATVTHGNIFVEENSKFTWTVDNNKVTAPAGETVSYVDSKIGERVVTGNQTPAIPDTVTVKHYFTTAPQYTLTYDANGATTGTAPAQYGPVNAGTSITVATKGDLAKSGYEFTGWNTQADGSGTAYVPNDDITLASNMTLFAQWTPIDYKVTYHNDSPMAKGDVVTYTDDKDYHYGDKVCTVDEKVCNFTALDRYQFAGWTTNKYSDDVEYAADEELTITGNVDLYAIWTTEDVYYVVYNSNYSTGDNAQSNPYSNFFNQLAKVEECGFKFPAEMKFAGWATKATGDVEFTPGDSITEDVRDAAVSAEDKTANLFAVWVPLELDDNEITGTRKEALTEDEMGEVFGIDYKFDHPDYIVPQNKQIVMSEEDLAAVGEFKIAYKIVVKGDAGTAFSVTDEDVEWINIDEDIFDVDGDTVSGRLDSDGEVTLYCVKTFTAEDVENSDNQTVVNVAIISNDSNDGQDDITVDETTDIKTEGIAVTKKLISEGPFADGDKVRFEITVTNLGNTDVENIRVIEKPGSGLVKGHFINVKDGVDSGFSVDPDVVDPGFTIDPEEEGVTPEVPEETPEVPEETPEVPEVSETPDATESEDSADVVDTATVPMEAAAAELTPYLDEDGDLVIPVLKAGETMTFTYVATVDTDGDSFSNTVIVKDEDGNELDKDKTPEVEIQKDSSLLVKKSINENDTRPERGDWVRYTITVTNNGEVDLKEIYVKEKPDSDLFSEWEFIGWDSDDEGVKVEFTSDSKAEINKLDAGEKVELSFRAKVAKDAPKNEKLVNNVTVECGNVTDDATNEDAKVNVPNTGGGGGSHKPSKPSKPTEVPPALNGDDHFQYVQGYPDGTVGPERNITRAEATVIFFRLLKDSVREDYLTVQNSFPDVRLADWFNVGVSTMENGNFVSGYEDGTFRPNGYITRAELAVIISNFDDLEASDSTKFADARGHWAEKYINSAAEKGWISGYDDGLFRPNQFITRAETMSMINRVLQRRVDADGLHKDAHQWRDNKPGKWYYYDVLEATNHHDYERADDELVENWTAINPDKIWEN